MSAFNNPMRRFLLVAPQVEQTPTLLQSASAEIIILDLCAADVAASRSQALGLLRQGSASSLFVRTHPVSDPRIDADLAALMPGRPAGILLSGSRNGIDVQHLSVKLAVHEACNGFAHESTAILAAAADTPAAVFGLASYAGASRRLAGLVETSAALAASLGLDEGWDLGTPALAQARGMLVLGAASAGVPAIAFAEVIDTPWAARAQEAGFAAVMSAPRR